MSANKQSHSKQRHICLFSFSLNNYMKKKKIFPSFKPNGTQNYTKTFFELFVLMHSYSIWTTSHPSCLFYWVQYKCVCAKFNRFCPKSSYAEQEGYRAGLNNSFILQVFSKSAAVILFAATRKNKTKTKLHCTKVRRSCCLC